MIQETTVKRIINLVKTYPEVTQILELADDEDIKTLIINYIPNV